MYHLYGAFSLWMYSNMRSTLNEKQNNFLTCLITPIAGKSSGVEFVTFTNKCLPIFRTGLKKGNPPKSSGKNLLSSAF